MSLVPFYFVGIVVGIFLYLSYQAIFRQSLPKQALSLYKSNGGVDILDNQLRSANISISKACEILKSKYKIETPSLSSLSRSAGYYWIKLKCEEVLHLSDSSFPPNHGVISDIAIPKIPQRISEWCSAMRMKYNVLPVTYIFLIYRPVNGHYQPIQMFADDQVGYYAA